VFLPREDYLWPGKVVKPMKDYKSYKVRAFESRKVETLPFASLIDYTPSNKDKCLELFGRL
jgi:hypothetical protein